MKIHASTNGISTVAIPKLGCGWHQTNWPEVLNLLRDVLAYAYVQIVVHARDENGVHTVSTEDDAEFYTDDKIE